MEFTFTIDKLETSGIEARIDITITDNIENTDERMEFIREELQKMIDVIYGGSYVKVD